MITLSTAFFLFVLGTGLGLLGLWLYYDRRDHRIFEGERRRTIFHCVRCSKTYSVKGVDPDSVCPCPQCGHANTRLRY
jgi:DNA-directed RNA polymerase subunit RPC12/RpoP